MAEVIGVSSHASAFMPLCLDVAMYKETHPILGTRDIQRAIEFYTQQLGFKLAFGDKANSPNYVGFRRDAVVLHMQFQFEHEMGTIRLRFLVENPDALFNEYRQRGVECTPNGVRDTPWGTREFALYDLDRNALTFYRDLTSVEKERQCS
jgi:catechol 2,3-dioxygenase-like lactoylglutathione lyase family enzyme